MQSTQSDTHDSGDLPPSLFKYHLSVITIVEEAELIADVNDESDDCSWEDIYRLYGCSPVFV